MNAACAHWLNILPPAAKVNDGAAAPAVIDTAESSYCEVLVALGAADAAQTTLSVTECDTDNGAFTAITGLVYGASQTSDGVTVSTLPQAADADGLFLFNIDLKGRKRFLQLNCTVADGSAGDYVAAVARLTRLETSPRTAAEMGVAGVLQSPAYGAN